MAVVLTRQTVADWYAYSSTDLTKLRQIIRTSQFQLSLTAKENRGVQLPFLSLLVQDGSTGDHR